MFALAAPFLGLAYALSGRAAEALALLERAVQQADSLGIKGLQSLRVAHLSEGYLLAGRVQHAIDGAAHALESSRSHNERGIEAWIRRLLGEIYSHRDRGEVENAEESYCQAMALATELSMRPLVAHCHLGLGKLYARTGKRQQAQEHLATASTMYREMDMRFWLDKAEKEMKEA